MHSSASRSSQTSVLLDEARAAPAAVARQAEALRPALDALAARLRADPPRFLVTAARGSSDHAAHYAKYAFETRLGLPTVSAAPSVTTLYGGRLALGGALFLAISQSGRSPDLIAQTEAARAAGALTVALVNDAGAPLADAAEIALDIAAGPERAVAATKSFVASVAAVLRLIAAWAEDRELAGALAALPDRLAAAEPGTDAGGDWGAATELLGRIAHVMTVGRGPGLPIAGEAALKLKETCALHAEPYSGAELMHGPVTLLGPEFPALVFLPEDAAAPGLRTLCRQLAEQGVPVLAVAPANSPSAPAPPVSLLPGPAPLHPVIDPLVLLQAFYLRLPDIAAARGRDPDAPPRLSKVTRTL